MTDAELTRRLAERVMGWQVYQELPFSRPTGYTDWLIARVENKSTDTCFVENDGRVLRYKQGVGGREWRPLEDMNDAIVVVERMQELDWRCHMKNWHISKDWMVTFACGAAEHSITDRPCSRAICRAALAAVGVEVPDA